MSINPWKAETWKELNDIYEEINKLIDETTESTANLIYLKRYIKTRMEKLKS